MEKSDRNLKYVVVGGGIAAVCCVEQLACLDPDSKITMVSASRIVKSVSNVQQIGKAMESFDIVESEGNNVFGHYANVSVLFEFCTKIDPIKKELYPKSGKNLPYDKLCLAVGGKPKLISDNHLVIGIRDTESVDQFQQKLHDARRILIVGNGGIASELIYELKNIEIIWAIKHKSILSTFVDAGAAEFLLPRVNEEPRKSSAAGQDIVVTKRLKYSHDKTGRAEVDPDYKQYTKGSALGPDWVEELNACGSADVPKNVHVEFECEIDRIVPVEEMFQKKLKSDRLPDDKFNKHNNEKWPIFVKLTNGKLYGCDFVVSATGVSPNVSIQLEGDSQFKLADDGGILVDDQMQSNVPDIYAAGDICTAGWHWYPHWIQMRLWTQAKQMGAYAGKCMFYNARQRVKMEMDLCFEIFTHVTKFFGYKVVLLGLFNSQTLRTDHEAHVRIKKGEEYVKVLIQDGKVQGAVLIGETDLEETFENLILNQIDVSGLDLLHNAVDIEDYFD